MALTKRQKEVLDFLADFIEENGYSPSYEELAQGLSLSSLASVHKHIEGLESRRYLSRGFNQSRSLEVSPAYLEERRRARSESRQIGDASIPLLGRIAAGAPVEAIAGEDSLHFSDFTSAGNTFALKVQGESMIEDHICPNDFVLVEKTAEVRDGEIVVALVGGSEATLKRLYREPGDHIRLQPSNAQMKPMIFNASDVEVQGRVLAVLRKYK